MNQFLSRKRSTIAALFLLLVLLVTACGGAKGDSPETSSSLETPRLVAFFEARVERDPQDYVSLNGLAAAFAQRGRETGDIAFYGRALPLLERSVDLLSNRGNYAGVAQLAGILNTHHQFATALPLAEQAVALRPDLPLGYGVLADALLELGRTSEAREALQTMVGIERNLPAVSRLARVSMISGDFEGAEQLWLEAQRAANPSIPENAAWTHAQLGHVYIDMGRLDLADIEFDRSLRALPGYVHAIAGRGRLAAARGDHDKALDRYDKALEQIALPEYAVETGKAFDALGRQDQARREYDRAASLYDGYDAHGIDTNLQRATLLLLQGDVSTALERGRAAWDTRHDVEAARLLANALDRVASPEAELWRAKAAELM